MHRLNGALLLIFSLFIFGCQNSTDGSVEDKANGNITTEVSFEEVPNDTLIVLQAFENLKEDRDFLKSLYFKEGQKFSVDKNKILFGDLNGDGADDALLYFSVIPADPEGTTELYYAIFVKESDTWNYQSFMHAGNKQWPYYISLEAIEDGRIRGNGMHNYDAGWSDYPVAYRFKNGKLIQTFAAPHKDVESEVQFLGLSGFITKELVEIPIEVELKVLKKILSRGKIEMKEWISECGTRSEEFDGRHWLTSFFDYEISAEDRAFFNSINLKGSEITVMTQRCTLSEETTFEELEKAFSDVLDMEWNDEDRSIMFMQDEGDDRSVYLFFDKGKKLERIEMIEQC